MTGPRHLLSVADLSPSAVDALLDRAEELRRSGHRTLPAVPAGSAALLFLSSSLRTRLGHAAAAAQLGLTPITIDELRGDATMSGAESFADTIRVVSGLVDLIVTRTPFALDRAMVRRECHVPLINGGDGEHPTQALIDLAAIRRFVGPPSDLRIGIVGDAGMQAVRSLLLLLGQAPPLEVRLVAPAGRDDPAIDLPSELRDRLVVTHEWDTTGLDVVYMAGLPEVRGGVHLDAPARTAFTLDDKRVRALGHHAVVLCPLPRIDEIADDVRDHPTVRMFDQSDHGLHVRTAIIEHLLDR